MNARWMAALPIAVAWAIVTTAPRVVVIVGVVTVEALARLLGLHHCVRAALDRQVVLTVLQLALLQLLLLLALLLLKLLLALVLLGLIYALLVTLAFLLLALLIEALLLVLLDLPLLLQLLLLALLLVLLLLLLALLLLLLLLLLALLILLSILIEAALLVLLLLTLHVETVLTLFIALLLLLLIVIVGQHLSADTQGQKTDTCQTPDARVHAFLTAARIPVNRTAFWVRRSPHSISVAIETVGARLPATAVCQRSMCV
jgi:hypothetical protein